MSESIELYERTKGLQAGDKLSMSERLQVIQDIREDLEGSDLSVRDIANRYGVTYNTANEWRNQALMLMAKQDNGLTRDALRNINRGQIEHQIRKLTKQLEASELEDQLKIHDRLIKYRDSLARITGLNSETVNHTQSQAPLQIIMPQEAELIDNTIDTLQD